MSDAGHGVYVSIRTTDGVLFSSSRPEWAMVREDLVAMFGDEYVDTIVSTVSSSFEPEAAPQTPIAGPESHGEAPAALSVVSDPPMTVEEVAEALGATVPAPTQTFEKCEICGALKDQWKPGGVSQSGKKYPGFFGCNNFRNHPRR